MGVFSNCASHLWFDSVARFGACEPSICVVGKYSARLFNANFLFYENHFVYIIRKFLKRKFMKRRLKNEMFNLKFLDSCFGFCTIN